MPQGTGLPLILAVEADSRQAAELSSLFENEFSAELVLASSAQKALAAIGTRVPDLVLTSALIPPKDEAALTAWLRNLGDAAAHVQTVTIPALATPKAATTSLGSKALSLVRQRPAVSAPDSCDRAVFADYVALYLDLAAGER
jgi:CheY-like chemotaxis protein